MRRIIGTFGVRRVIGLGAYPASSPHTRPSRLSATAATPDLASLGFTPATLDVPAGIQAALELAHHAAGIESVGLWAQVPHYISGAHYPAASLALVPPPFGVQRAGHARRGVSTSGR